MTPALDIKSLDFVFLIETKNGPIGSYNFVTKGCIINNFVVDPRGQLSTYGGLVMSWSNSVDVNIIQSSSFFIWCSISDLNKRCV